MEINAYGKEVPHEHSFSITTVNTPSKRLNSLLDLENRQFTGPLVCDIMSEGELFTFTLNEDNFGLKHGKTTLTLPYDVDIDTLMKSMTSELYGLGVRFNYRGFFVILGSPTPLYVGNPCPKHERMIICSDDDKLNFRFHNAKFDYSASVDDYIASVKYALNVVTSENLPKLFPSLLDFCQCVRQLQNLK
jgi:hypothetical protein